MAKSRVIDDTLQTERLQNGQRRLLRDLKLDLTDIIGFHLVVPKGTETDFSSIPQMFAGIVRWSKVDIAGVGHDYLYQTGILDRKICDKAWWALARSGKHRANRFQAWTCYRSLRIGGWHAWNYWRKKDKD